MQTVSGVPIVKSTETTLSAVSCSSSTRLASLDLFRGVTIAAMILVNNPGNAHPYWPLEHAEWNGWTPTDLIFPFFLFKSEFLWSFLPNPASRAAIRGQSFYFTPSTVPSFFAAMNYTLFLVFPSLIAVVAHSESSATYRHLLSGGIRLISLYESSDPGMRCDFN